VLLMDQELLLIGLAVQVHIVMPLLADVLVAAETLILVLIQLLQVRLIIPLRLPSILAVLPIQIC
jgi:hypothetical protein